MTIVCGTSLIGYALLGSPALVYTSLLGGSYFALKSAWESLNERVLDVNFLMILAALGALYVGNAPDAAILLFLFSLSSTLESLAMSKTQSAIEQLIKLRPETAIKVVADQDQIVQVKDLCLGDRIRVLPFEQVPVDGCLLSENAEINESMITGESAPISKSQKDTLLAGTQNLDQVLLMEVTSTMQESTLQKMIKLVQEAQENKASGEHISQWFGQRYTLFVMATFIVTLGARLLLHVSFHEALAASITLLVAMSPCAIVIASPSATLSALAWCARRGILVRGGEFIELAGKLDAIAFDKTGTLTQGQFELVKIESFSENISWELGNPFQENLRYGLCLAASLEQFSTHPIAKAIVDLALKQNLLLDRTIQTRVVPGLGVEAEWKESFVQLGQQKMFAQKELPPRILECLQENQQAGYTTVLLKYDQHWMLFLLEDTLRPIAKGLIQNLKNLGLQNILMLTGDHRRTAKGIAEKIGIVNYYPELLPEQKEELLAELIASKKVVMMVGDGVNDAPSLARAHIGVAMGGLGSEVALNSADVVLVQDRLEKLVDFIQIGRSVNNIIRFNLMFAIGMVICLTLFSLFFYLPLPLAVLGHEGSTVLVILNSLRLLKHPFK